MKKINKHISRYLFFTVLMVIIGLIVVQKYNSDKQGKEIGKVMPAQSGVAGLCYHYRTKLRCRSYKYCLSFWKYQ